jgi:hypothetical protein
METNEFHMAVAGNKDVWVPACGGSEQQFTCRTGMRLLYCFNPRLGNHAYLDCGTDMILTDEEARAALNL